MTTIQDQNCSSIMDLPDEILVQILERCSNKKSKTELSVVCSRFGRLFTPLRFAKVTKLSVKINTLELMEQFHRLLESHELIHLQEATLGLPDPMDEEPEVEHILVKIMTIMPVNVTRLKIDYCPNDPVKRIYCTEEFTSALAKGLNCLQVKKLELLDLSLCPIPASTDFLERLQNKSNERVLIMISFFL